MQFALDQSHIDYVSDRVKSPADVDEIVQVSDIDAWKARERMPDDPAESPRFIQKIVRDTMLKHWRAKMRRESRVQSSIDDAVLKSTKDYRQSSVDSLAMVERVLILSIQVLTDAEIDAVRMYLRREKRTSTERQRTKRAIAKMRKFAAANPALFAE